MQTKKFICCRVNSLRKTAGTLAEKVRIKTGDFISNLACGTGEVPYTKVTSAYNSGNAPTMSMLDTTDALALADEYALDLSDEKWVSECGDQVTKVDGKVVSYPFCVEGRGLIVNKKAIEDTLGKEFLNWMVYNETAQKLLFIEPDVWEFLNECEEIVKPYGVTLLPEIHEHYTMQERIAEKDYYVYDFALPMLLINALYYGQTQYLKNWLNICPRKQFTTLDTHDGIGVVDVKDLLPDEEIDRTKEDIFKFGANVKKIYNTAAYNNLDIYQVNCSYYSALGDDDASYLLARAVQFFAPGIPQVYYVGLLAGRNDLKLLEETKVGRNINRHYYSIEEIDNEVERPVVKSLLALMKFRNEHPAFDGGFELLDCTDDKLVILRKNGDEWAKLNADFAKKTFEVIYSENGGEKILNY